MSTYAVQNPGTRHIGTRCREGSAIISACGRYRYVLTRDVREEGVTYPHAGHVLWVMLNPSTADGGFDDNTVRRCIGFTRTFGYPAFVICNLCAFRSTNPDGLRAAADPVGPENEAHIRREAERASLIIAAWGRHATQKQAERVLRVLREFNDVWCLGVSATSRPMHPLMLPSDSERRMYARRLAR